MTGTNAELTQRWQGALMDELRHPAGCRLLLVRGEGTKLWDADGEDTSTSSAVSPSTRLGSAAGRSSRPSAADRPPRRCLQPVRRRAAVALAERLLLQLGRRPSSATGARRPAGDLESASSPARAWRWWPPTAGSTAAPWGALALTRASPGSRSRSCRCPVTSHTCPTVTRRRWPRPSPENTPW